MIKREGRQGQNYWGGGRKWKGGLWYIGGGLKWSPSYLPGPFHHPMRRELRESPNDDNVRLSLGQHPQNLWMSFRESGNFFTRGQRFSFVRKDTVLSRRDLCRIS